MRADAFAELAGAAVIAGEAERTTTGVSIDSRTTSPGDVFVALPGERAHGAEFATAAIERGAAAVLVPKDRVGHAAPGGVPVLTASDTLVALQSAAAAYRSTLGATVVGITGSTGKTTTKDLLQGALAGSRSVVASARSHNNEIGVPLTLLGADDATDVVIVEMAMRGQGQIRELALMARPSVGVVVNVGVTHFELLGSVEAIARAKGELLEELPGDGLAVLNGDDGPSTLLVELSRARVVRFGLGDANDVRADRIEVSDDGLVAFEVSTAGVATGESAEASAGRVHVELPLRGRHNVYNALAAFTVAEHLGVSPGRAAAGLAQASPSPMRLDVFKTEADVTVVDDCYNASPQSMAAALVTLKDMRVAGRRVAVLGEMLELGALSVDEHLRVGELAVEAGVKLLVTVGEQARSIAAGALRAGLGEDAWVAFQDARQAAAGVAGLIGAGDAVLVKASRLVGLERVVEALRNGTEGGSM